jgi:hypothetical protein
VRSALERDAQRHGFGRIVSQLHLNIKVSMVPRPVG